MKRTFTTGSLARLKGWDEWRVRRLFEDGDLPEPPRLGQYRLLSEDDIPLIEEAMRRRGFLPAEQAAQPDR